MKRIISVFILALMLLGIAVMSSGCDDNFDWEKAAKNIAMEWIKDKVVVAVGKYAGDNTLKGVAIDWVMDNVNKAADDSDILAKGLKYVDVEGAISEVWDYYIAGKLYEVARDYGMDTDADDPDPYEWYVSGADFPELNDTLLEYYK